MAFTDFNRDPWWAPAGLQRGRLVDVLDVEHSPSQGERDFMYSGGNAVNPIPNFTKDGVVIWGQRTLQRAPTALDRINVRRLLLVIKKAVSTAVRFLVFEPNDEFLERQFVNLVNPFLRGIQARRGLVDFRVISATTDANRDRNEFVGRIFLKPVKAAEIIELEFVVVAQTANFEEFISPTTSILV